MNKQVGLDHVYFIFADNCYEQNLTDTSFRALINFYLLLYNKIVIPDVYFINNKKLYNFLIEEDNMQYIEKGIIIPSVREGRSSFEEIYQNLKASNTVINHTDNEVQILNMLEKIDIEKGIKWSLDEVASNFKTNFLDNVHILGENESNKIHQCIAQDNDARRPLNRVELHRMAGTLFPLRSKEYYELMNYIDITYNFNLPNLMGFSAAYPSTLQNLSSKITPEQVFIKDSMMKVQKEVIAEDILMTNFFDIGLLASLNFEQIQHFKSLKEHKRFVKSFTTNKDRGNKIGEKFSEYIHIFENELPRVINNKHYSQIKKHERKLSIKNYMKDYVGSEGNTIVLEALLEASSYVTDTMGMNLIGRALNIVMSPITKKNKKLVKQLEVAGRNEIYTKRSNASILKSFKEFSISNIQN